MENKAHTHSGYQKIFSLVIKLTYSEKHIFIYQKEKMNS